MFKILSLSLKTNITLLPNSLDRIMVLSLLYLHFIVQKVFYTKKHVLKHLNKMQELRENTNIYLMQLKLSYLSVNYLTVFGLMLSSLSTKLPLPSFTRNLLIMFFMIMSLIFNLSRTLDPYVMHQLSNTTTLSFSLELESQFYWVINQDSKDMSCLIFILEKFSYP